MVSTRQMTGATSEEANLNVCRAVPTSSSTSSYTSSNVVSISSSISTKTATGLHSASSPGGSLPALSGNVSSNFVLRADDISLGMVMSDLQEHQHQEINLMDLPTELLGHIFSYVGYKKIAHMRVISRQMNKVCSSILNSTFQKLQNQMHSRFQTVKAKMPRRESARRNHPLACECDILETCYMRLSLLQMTFGKHIERKHCCFFPGGILDEVYSVLNYIRTSPSLDRPFKVTDELFDLSTMAMEYFKEHIEPNLPDIAYFTNSTKSFAALETSSSILSRDTSHSSSSSPPQSNMVLRKGIRKIKQGMKRYNNQLTVLRSELRTFKRKATEQAKTITEQQKLLAEQQKQTLEFANRLDETDKKNDELSRKFSTVLQELNKCKTELQYWRSKSPATTICSPYGQIVSSYDLGQNLGNQSTVPYDIELLSMGITRNANTEETRKKDDSGHSKEKVEHNLQLVKLAGDSSVLIESADSPPAILTKPVLKRKLECVTVGTDSSNSDGACGNEPVQLDGLACLNPPFASASLTASYSSSSLPSAMHALVTPSQSTDGNLLISTTNQLKDKSGISTTEKSGNVGLLYSSAEGLDQMSEMQSCSSTNHDVGSNGTSLPIASENPFFSNTKAIHQSNNNETLIQNSDSKNNSSSFSSNVDSKNDSSSNDSNTNYHMKKIRRVQNKARSQSYNKHTNHSATINTHTKTTRSKQLDKQTGN